MEITCPRCGGRGELTVNTARFLRERVKMKQGELAAKLGLSQSALSRLEASRHFPWRHRVRLCEIFGVTRDQLEGTAPLDPKPARPKRAPPAGAIAKSRARRAAVKKKNKARSRK